MLEIDWQRWKVVVVHFAEPKEAPAHFQGERETQSPETWGAAMCTCATARGLPPTHFRFHQQLLWEKCTYISDKWLWALKFQCIWFDRKKELLMKRTLSADRSTPCYPDMISKVTPCQMCSIFRHFPHFPQTCGTACKAGPQSVLLVGSWAAWSDHSHGRWLSLFTGGFWGSLTCSSYRSYFDGYQKLRQCSGENTITIKEQLKLKKIKKKKKMHFVSRFHNQSI